MIFILWATCRPNTFKKTHQHWIKNARNPANIKTYVAVDTEEEKASLPNFNVMVTGSESKGVCFPCYCLSRNLIADDRDIVVFASDDFFPPYGWDKMIQGLIGREECVLVLNDGIQKFPSEVVTLPIMTYGALKKMNYVIYHPAYQHMYSDVELYLTAKKLGFLKDVRRTFHTVFTHKHYVCRKRAKDSVDLRLDSTYSSGKIIFETRKALSLEEVLKVDPVLENRALALSGASEEKQGTNPIKLSILICTIPARKQLFERLMRKLKPQLTPEVEIIPLSDNKKMPIGLKRNLLLEKSKGDYVCFIDDDDLVSDDYVSKVLRAVSGRPDCCSIQGIFTEDGRNPTAFKHSIAFKEWTTGIENGEKVYYRCPNHLNAIRRDLALKTGFNPELNHGEDKDFSDRLFPLLKTEATIEGSIYNYLFISKKRY